MATELGKFIDNKRQEKEISLRELARQAKMTASYMSDIINGNRVPQKETTLMQIVQALSLNEDDTKRMMELAELNSQQISPDVVNYVNNTPAAKILMRKAKDKNLPAEFWTELLEKLDNKEEE